MSKLYNFGSVLLLLLFLLAFTACTRSPVEGPRAFVPPDIGTDFTPNLDFGWTGIDLNTHGELSIKVWGGNGTEIFWDAGRYAHDPSTILNNVNAGIIAAAQVFNQYFPNVVINAVNITGRGGGGVAGRIDDRNMFLHEHGRLLDVFYVSSVPVEMELGLISPLCLFADDPVWDLFNPTILNVMNMFNRLFAVPVYIIPQGFYFNRGMAEQHNLDAPPVNWTFHDYAFLARQFRTDEFFGANDFAFYLLDTGTAGFWHNLVFRQQGDPFTFLDHESTRWMLGEVPLIRPFTLTGQRHVGTQGAAWVDGRGGWRLFAEGGIMIHHGDAMMLTYAGSPTHSNRVQVNDWDVLPRPSTDWVPNHMGTIADAMGLFHYAMLSDSTAPGILSHEGLLQKQLAWEFLRFFAADIRAFHARNNFVWGHYDNVASNAGFSYLTGQLYRDVMDIWFDNPCREIFANPNRFPGLHYMMDLWEQGNFWRFTHNIFPWNDSAGTAISTEWNSRSAGGVTAHAPNWRDEMLVRLPVFDIDFNNRWEYRFFELYNNMRRWYG